MKFLETHKHLAITIVVAAAILILSYKIVAHMDGVAHDQRVLAEEKVKEDMAKAELLAKQSQIDSDALQAQLDSLTASNQALQAQLTQLRQQLSAQRAKDAALPLPELALRWGFLVPTGKIKASPDGGVMVDDAAAHATVSALEEIPVLQEEKKGIEANSEKKDETIRSALKLRDDKQNELEACKVNIKDKDNACDLKIKEIKDNYRKKGMWATLGGFISGVILGRKF